MPFLNDHAENLRLKDHRNHEEVYAFAPGTILVGNNNIVKWFKLDGYEYFYKDSRISLHSAIDLIQHASSVATWGERGSAYGVPGIIALTGLQSYFEIQKHLKDHHLTGYFSGKDFYFHGPIHW